MEEIPSPDLRQQSSTTPLLQKPPSIATVSPFYEACRNNNIRLVERYLQTMSVEEIDRVEPNGSTALHVAAFRGYEEIVDLLLKKGASYTIINKYKLTALDEAKTDKIKRLFRRRTNHDRFVSQSVEWIRSTDNADFLAHEYFAKLETYGRDPKFYELIAHIKAKYIEKKMNDMRDIDQIKNFFDLAINKRDPVYLVKAYTADTGFYSTLNIDLARIEPENLTATENRALAYYVGIVARHPKLESLSFTGETYRGMMVTNEDIKQYKIGTRILTKTFSSSSKEPDVAMRFLAPKDASDDRSSALCTYKIRNERTALDIENESLFADEKEVLILPYSAFKIIDIKQNIEKQPKYEITLKECEPW